ncbi:ATP-dependent DNA helicase UvrD2 [Rhodococcus sp. UNC23MFCrub1.1]|uniref:ATP-dependent DNA helicase UvrD2 n=1 Tax=Rhodococcus sp. UNC23MFCrub1.1 TaxID=1449068 RepID=UPI0004874DBD|nr:ATP-dependent DNA helicase UvrD2 [Rhodococcus sp. UNC23MFCrub1.1]
MNDRDAVEGLDPEQSAAVLAPRGPVCVLAGAGTGKTRTITRRIAHLVADGHVKPSQVLAVTFTARAAGEMRERLRVLGIRGQSSDGQVQARTFHAAAMRQLKYFWPQVVGNTDWRLLDRKFGVVGQAASAAGVSTSTDSVRDLAGEIEWAKASLIAPEDYPAAAARLHRDTPTDADRVAAVYEGYEELKNRDPDAVLLDFDDLLLHTAAALENSPSVAQEFRERYRCFVVDEYQDVTPLQQRVLDAWLGDRDDLTVVGDANQTIYSFTGATPRFLLDFSRRFPEATVVRLERDYRSTPEVVELANKVIGAAKGRIAGTRLQLIGQRAAGRDPTFVEYDDEVSEAAGVARTVQRLIRTGTAPSEIAVLYRINAHSEAHEKALTDLAIPYQIRGGESFFQRQDVRSAVAAVRSSAARDDLPSDARSGAGLPRLVEAVLAPLGLSATEPNGAQAREKWAALRALVALTEDLVVQVPDLDLEGLVREFAMRAEARHPPVVEGVTLASLHAAKGLEWDAVFLVGLTDGTLPISHALGDNNSSPDEAAVEEERRLLYVGVTRAREHLELSWALARNEGGRKSRRRSRFLVDLVPESSPASRIAAPTVHKKRPVCRVCGKPVIGTVATMLGRCENCPSDVDIALLESLRTWRSETSKALKVPAYVVFSDNTLTAIAEQRPRDDRGLVAIPGIGAKKLERFGADVLALVDARLSATE